MGLDLQERHAGSNVQERFVFKANATDPRPLDIARPRRHAFCSVMSDSAKAVFLSYASQDAEAARRIAEALRAAGIEVWFDQSELVGGDAWDAKIRRQIAECALFTPVISANTQARREGYFRLEWKLAAQRTHMIADGTPFLLPVVIDATRDAAALVPPEFSTVQWIRLPSGETPEKFCERVKKLLGQSEPAGAALRRDGSEESGHKAPPAIKPSRSWPVPAIIGVVAIAVLALWQPWKETAVSPAAAKTVESAKPAAPLTEAQKLVAQARRIYEEGDELNRENLLLAEEFVQRALALDSAEPAAWELAAWLSYQMVWHSIDESPARRETLLRQANRAVALAPDGVAAQLVFANAQLVGRTGKSEAAVAPGYYGEIQRSLQRLAEQEPRNWKIQRALGTVYRNLNLTDEAIRSLQRALELSGEDPVASADLVNVLIRRQHYPEAEAILARALARQRSGRLLTFDVVVKCRWRGDPVGALKSIELWPAWLLRENRGVAVAWQAAYWGRQPERALSIVQEVTRDYLRDVNFAGPRAVLSARAHELAGNTVAAQADWRLVVQRCDQDLAGNSQDVGALFWKAWALVRLGDPAGAQATATLVRQQMQSVPSNFFKTQPAATLWAMVGWTDLALSDLRGLLEKPGDEVSLTRAYLELEPAFDSLRQDPRFQVLLGQAPAPKKPEDGGQKSVLVLDDKSVAVLAFANLSDDKGNEYFSDGISEELLNVLAKVPGLKVSARTSAQQLQLKLGAAAGTKQIVNPEAYGLVLEGRHFLTLRTATGFDQAARAFTEALRLDPQFAQAQAGLANTTALRGRYRLLDGVGRVEEFDQLAIAQSRLALQMDPSLAEPHAAIGFVLTDRRQLAEAEQEFQKAFAANPNYATAYHWHSHVYGVRGRLDLALKEIGRATTLDPLSFIMTYILGFYTCDTQRYAEALAILDRAASLRGQGESFLPLEADRARMLLALGRPAEALAVARKVLHDPRLITAGWYAAGEAIQVLQRGGETAEAARLAESLIPAMPPGSYQRGYVLCALGRFREGLPQLASMPVIAQNRIYWHPMFDPVRDTPEFRQLLVKLGCVEEYKVARATLARMQQEQEAKK
ncbi:MAG: TIR domain-containing protein [Opitutae bacterium]|nr:TIR domain-containing protein [Opitutae bacterium]